MDDRRFPIVYQRQHAVWTQSFRFVGVRLPSPVDNRRCGRNHYFLLRYRRTVGRGDDRFSASFNFDAFLRSTGHQLSRTGWRRLWIAAFSAARDENNPHFRRIRMDLPGLLDGYGFLRIQHQRNGAEVF